MTLRARLAIDYYAGGTAHVLLKPIVMLMGILLRRNHTLRPDGDVAIVKLLGGGSLVIAYPALLALKRRPGVNKLRLLASPATRPFAEILGIFDEIIVVRDGGLGLLVDSVHAIAKLWRCDTLVDLEVHSRLTTVFCTLTCARNRVGFYTTDSFWRKGLSTHLLFCQLNEGIYNFYDQVARILGGTVGTLEDASVAFRQALGVSPATEVVAGAIAIAPCCSELGRERMLDIDEWALVMSQRYAHPRVPPTEVHLLGGNGDRPYLSQLQSALSAALPGARILNRAGELKLRESVALLTSIEALFAIDSSMLHFARLLGVPTTSFWGPTDPMTRLRPRSVAADEVHYAKIPCSPCVHISSQTPCKGNNVCIRFAVNPYADADRNPPWLA